MKKAQMQILTTIAILFVFFVLVGIGLIIYANLKTRDIKSRGEDLGNIRATQMAQAIFSLPELKCPEQATGLTGCIDYESTKRPITTFLGEGNATIRYLTLKGEQKSVVIYNNQKQNYKKKEFITKPINLYSQANKNYLYGILEIEVYI